MPLEPATRVIALGELLHQYPLGLVLIAGADEHTSSRPVQWVHVSEIEDPAPFLPPATVLLTTGARFSAIRRQNDADAYIDRLVKAGVAALGVGVGLHWDRVPPRIVSACDRLGLPLFRVPYDTPFIAIVQSSVRLLEARDRERDLWSLESQRAVSNASLHPEGLSAVLQEAAARLGRWVCIADRSGRIIEFAPEEARDDAPVEALGKEVRRLLDRGVSAARIGTGGGGIQLQTLGRPVRGILIAEEAGTPDAAERNMLGLVAALATAQLEHRTNTDTARDILREAVVELLIGGQADLASKLAANIPASLPSGEIVVLRHEQRERLPLALLDELRRLEQDAPGFFSATFDDAPLIIVEAHLAPTLRKRFHAHRVVAGLSERASLSAVDLLIDQATRALEHAIGAGGESPVDYSADLHPGVMGLLHEHPDAARRAGSLLDPLRQYDAKHHEAVEKSLHAWLARNGQTSMAAADLGVHRHTLRSRLRTASGLLQVDLESPDARAELWTALRLAGASPQDPGGSTV